MQSFRKRLTPLLNQPIGRGVVNARLTCSFARVHSSCADMQRPSARVHCNSAGMQSSGTRTITPRAGDRLLCASACARAFELARGAPAQRCRALHIAPFAAVFRLVALPLRSSAARACHSASVLRWNAYWHGYQATAQLTPPAMERSSEKTAWRAHPSTLARLAPRTGASRSYCWKGVALALKSGRAGEAD